MGAWRSHQIGFKGDGVPARSPVAERARNRVREPRAVVARQDESCVLLVRVYATRCYAIAAPCAHGHRLIPVEASERAEPSLNLPSLNDSAHLDVALRISLIRNPPKTLTSRCASGD